MADPRANAIEKLAKMQPKTAAQMPDWAMPKKRMTDAEFALVSESLGISEDELRREEAKVWAESVRRGIAEP